MLRCCIVAPEFSIQTCLRINRKLIHEERGIAVLDGPEKSLKVFACDLRSREAGIRTGMTKAKAQAWQNVLLLRRSRIDEDIAQAALVDCGFAISRRVESTCPGTVLCDLAGTERLLGSPANVANRLREITSRCGFGTNIAIASNADAALHAARGFPGITIIPPGQERKMLAPLSLQVLNAESEILGALQNWGIHTFKDLADLPTAAIAQRLGAAGIRLQQMAKGNSTRELIPVIPAALFQDRSEPEEPLCSLEMVCTAAQALLDQIVIRLKSRSLAARELHFELGIEKGIDQELTSMKAGERSYSKFTDTRKLKFSEATQDVGLMFKLLSLELERRPPQGFVTRIGIEALPATMRFVQHDFLRANAPESVKLDLTLAHLRSLHSQSSEEPEIRVGFAVVKDSFSPNSFYVTDCLSLFDTNSGQKSFSKDLPAESCRNIGRRRNASLTLDSYPGLEDGNAEAVIKGRRSKIVAAAGPWLGNGEWWAKENYWNRENWDLELRSRGRKSLYEGFCVSGSELWFIERMYD